MSWVRLDDQFTTHPKVVRAGDMAAWLWVCGLTYCAQHNTDGFIPAEAVPRLSGLKSTKPLVSKLLEVGLWETKEGGYFVHDYLDWQPSAEEVKERKEASTKRISRWREQQGLNRASNANVTPLQSGNSGVGNAVSNADVTSTPSPSPSPSPQLKTVARKPRAPVVPEELSSDHQRVIAVFHEEFERAKGAKPQIGPRNGKAAKDLLTQFAADDVCGMIRAAFADPWFVRTKGDLHDIAREPNKYRGTAPQLPIRGSPGLAVQPFDPNAPWLKTVKEIA